MCCALLLSGCLIEFPPPGGTGGGTGGGGGSDGGTVDAGCEGVSLESSRTLDLDVRRVLISGRVTLNGAALPAVTGGRGWLVFERTDAVDALRVPLQASGDFTYAVSLSAGEYALRYEPQDVAASGGLSSLCATTTSAPMPCVGGVLRRVSFSSSTSADVDLVTVRLTGAVTLNGGALPMATANRGTLHFGLVGGGVARTVAFGTMGAYAYDVHLLRGSYVVSYDSEQTPCPRNWPMPCNRGGVLRTYEAMSSTSLDLDLPAVQVSGTLRQDGAALPDLTMERGRLEFTRGTETPFLAAPFVATGDATYAVQVLRGRYTIVYRPPAGLCNGVTAPALVCTGATVSPCN